MTWLHVVGHVGCLATRKCEEGDMNRLSTVLASAFLAVAGSGCISVKSYLEPTLPTSPKATLADLQRPAAPTPLSLSVEFRRDGEPNDKATNFARQKITAALEATQVLKVVDGPSANGADHLRVIMDNLTEKNAAAKGFGTGLTLGLAGSTVTDRYVFTATFQRGQQRPVEKSYKHAIVSTVGNASGPAGLTPMKLDDAVTQMVQDLVISLVRDLQVEGHLRPRAVTAAPRA